MVDAQAIFVATTPTLTVLIGILLNNNRMSDLSLRISDVNKRIDELRGDMNSRFNEQGALFTEKLLRVEQVVDARLKHLEENRR